MIVDANVLIYAVDDTSAFHEHALGWLQPALAGVPRVGLPWASLLAFQRVTTHPRVYDRPLSAAAAWEFVTDWLAADPVWIPEPGPRHAEILGQLLIDGDLRGNLVTDGHLAALALEHGVGICSFDSDFALFPDVRWHNPARS